MRTTETDAFTTLLASSLNRVHFPFLVQLVFTPDVNHTTVRMNRTLDNLFKWTLAWMDVSNNLGCGVKCALIWAQVPDVKASSDWLFHPSNSPNPEDGEMTALIPK